MTQASGPPCGMEQVWTVSAERMKAKPEHRVPLCVRALEILDAARTPVACRLDAVGACEAAHRVGVAAPCGFAIVV